MEIIGVKEKEIAHNLNINNGDIVLVTSDIIDLMFYYKKKQKRIFNPNAFIDGLIEKIGENGTLLFPTYNWQFCHGVPFDYHNTKSETGLLSQIALDRKDFKRSKHPIYSFAIWGKHQNELCNIDNIQAFGDDSIFERLDRMKAKHLLVGRFCGTTHQHYAEQMCAVNYRFEKMFKGDYIDQYGDKSVKEYSMNVRDLDLEVVNIIDYANVNIKTDLELELENKGYMIINYINNIPFYILNISGFVEVIKNDIITNRGRKFCTYKGQED